MAGPRDSNRYTEAQLQAILHDVLMDGHKPAETVRRAAAGLLGIPAFDVDRRYIYQLIERHKDGFEAANPEALARSTYAALAKAHKLNLDALRALAPDTDPTERSRIAKAVGDSERTLNAAAAKPKPRHQAKTPVSHNTNAADEAPQGASVVTDLLAKAGEGARTGSLDRARNGVDPPRAA